MPDWMLWNCCHDRFASATALPEPTDCNQFAWRDKQRFHPVADPSSPRAPELQKFVIEVAMIMSKGAPTKFEQELGSNVAVVRLLSPEQCNDLLDLMLDALRRERLAAQADLEEKIAAHRPLTRAVIHALVFGRRR